MIRFLGLLAIAVSAAITALTPQTAWGAGTPSGSGVVAVTSYQEVISHAYIEEFNGVYLTGTWRLPGTTVVANLQAPNITVVSSDLVSGSVQPFSASGTGDGGVISLSCPGVGPATFAMAATGPTDYSVSFTSACTIERNGAAPYAVTFSANIAMPAVFHEIEGVYLPTGGSYSES